MLLFQYVNLRFPDPLYSAGYVSETIRWALAELIISPTARASASATGNTMGGRVCYARNFDPARYPPNATAKPSAVAAPGTMTPAAAAR